MQINLSIQIPVLPDRVFAALTTSVAYWWEAEYTQSADITDLVLEDWLGGRFYECWGNEPSQHEGALLATVTAIQKPKLIKLQGSFGFSEEFGVVTIILESVLEGTQVMLTYKVLGDFAPEASDQYRLRWQLQLERLKSFVEKHEAKGIRHDPSLENI